MAHAPIIVTPPAGQERACATRAASAMQLLAHPARLGILLYLAQCEQASVGDLETRVGVRQPTLSQQLGLLRAGGAVARVRRGRHAYYRLCDGAIARLVLALWPRPARIKALPAASPRAEARTADRAPATARPTIAR